MLNEKYSFRYSIAQKIIFFCLLLTKPAWGQVVPDGTTPTPEPGSCLTICVVTGGTIAGENLFHSFSQFSIPDGGLIRFDHDPTVGNIFARVTGEGIVSNINGFISTGFL